MTTSPSPQRSGRVARAPGQRRAASPQRASRAALQPADAAPDGSLSLVTEGGTTVHVASPTVTESMRYMLARLRTGDSVDIPHTIGVTSTIAGEGTSYIARSLALVLANDVARRVCLVDLNWWSPSPWGDSTAEHPGIAEVIRDGLPLEDMLLATTTPNLSVLPAGTATAAERPPFAHSPELNKAILELSAQFDHVVLDLPALTATSEALGLAEASGAVAFVVDQGVTPEAQVKAAIEELQGVTLLGVILNRGTSKIPGVIKRRIPGAPSLPW
jgi:Mrp family chromosome partitioning ATPase